MGGKQTTDDTYILKGTFTPNGGQQQQVNVDNFETSDKKGSTAIKHFRKADVAVMAGLGYTLDMGFDVDLRYYRSLSTTYDEQSGSSRLRLWTNLVEHIPFRNKDPSDRLLFPHGFSDVVVP